MGMKSKRRGVRIVLAWTLLIVAAASLALGLLGAGSAWQGVMAQSGGLAAGVSEGVIIGSSSFSSAGPPTAEFEITHRARSHPFVWWLEADSNMRHNLGVVAYDSTSSVGGGFGIQATTVAVIWWLPLLAGAAGLAAGIGIIRRDAGRRRRGFCVACGYSLNGLAPGTRCPECGGGGKLGPSSGSA